MEGIFSITTIPMGGNLVLLQPKEQGVIKALLGEDTICLPNWFQSFLPWNQHMLANEFYLFLNIAGVPLHAWREDFFKMVVSLVGKYDNMDESTRRKSRLDVGRIFATVSAPEAINGVFKVMIKDKVFSIKVIEDVFRFKP